MRSRPARATPSRFWAPRTTAFRPRSPAFWTVSTSPTPVSTRCSTTRADNLNEIETKLTQRAGEFRSAVDRAVNDTNESTAIIGDQVAALRTVSGAMLTRHHRSGRPLRKAEPVEHFRRPAPRRHAAHRFQTVSDQASTMENAAGKPRHQDRRRRQADAELRTASRRNVVERRRQGPRRGQPARPHRGHRDPDAARTAHLARGDRFRPRRKGPRRRSLRPEPAHGPRSGARSGEASERFNEATSRIA